jgi:uncharacterized protein involved in type VI secretion and phage assembly
MDELFGEPRPEAELAYIPGVVVGIVTNNQDPDGMGRVRVKLPSLGDADESDWARIAAPMAGKERGVYFLPEVDDEVLVAFEHGNPRSPFVLGALWNGQDAPPAKNDDGKNDVRVIKSRSGHLIRLTDKDGAEKIEIIDKSGKNSLVFDTAKKLVKIESSQDITLSAANGTIKLDAKAIEIASSGSATIEAKSRIDVKATGAPGAMTLKGATIDLN